MCLIYLVASLRTDLVHVVIFLTLVLAYGLIAGEEWSVAAGNSETAHSLQLAAAVFLLICDLAVWYLFIIEILASVDFPFTLPVVSPHSISYSYTRKLSSAHACAGRSFEANQAGVRETCIVWGVCSLKVGLAPCSLKTQRPCSPFLVQVRYISHEIRVRCRRIIVARPA